MSASETPCAGREAISFHYDLGNDFFRLFLDDRCTYSCAMFDGDAEDTEEVAQLRKLDYHARSAGAASAERILDIGCGWGSMLERLVSAHDVKHAVGLTLSAEQVRCIRELSWPGAEVREESWFDHTPAAPYDGIISIGAFEHFARPGIGRSQRVEGYRLFFDRCAGWLKRGGRLSLQTIAYGLSDRGTDNFLGTRIYPDSDLPRVGEISDAAEGIMELRTARNDRADYVRTLDAWLRRLRERREEAVALVGPELAHRFEIYLRISILGFASGRLNLLRLVFQRFDVPRPELVR